MNSYWYSACVGSENNCETIKSLKNDRLYVPTATKKRDIKATRLLNTRSNFSKSVVVSVAVSSLGASNIHVLEPGVKSMGRIIASSRRHFETDAAS